MRNIHKVAIIYEWYQLFFMLVSNRIFLTDARNPYFLEQNHVQNVASCSRLCCCRTRSIILLHVGKPNEQLKQKYENRSIQL